jgi:hypothetical protein
MKKLLFLSVAFLAAGASTAVVSGMDVIEWSQPPTYDANSPYPDCFWGWDEESVYGGNQIVADDWPSENTQRITGIHWWGSYLNWAEDIPPEYSPEAFHIGIWTDVPADSNTPWSHPGWLRRELVVQKAELSEQPVGCDFHEDYMEEPETCFLYELQLYENEWFWQSSTDKIYWFSIAAIYPDEPPLEYIWGWKTREHYSNGAAVRIFDPNAPVKYSPFVTGEPIEDYADNIWDMAFELITMDCMMETHPDYEMWVAYGKPDCWCHSVQCNGDIDGWSDQPVNVFIGDLYIFVSNFGSMQTTEPGVCADLDHQTELNGTVNVFMGDLNIFVPNFGAMQPACDDTHINFWLLQ